jgi:hypothetical protein
MEFDPGFLLISRTRIILDRTPWPSKAASSSKRPWSTESNFRPSALPGERKPVGEAYSEKFPIVTMNHAELCALAGFSSTTARWPRPASGIEKRLGIMADARTGRHCDLWLCLWKRHRPINVGALIRSAAGPGGREASFRRWLRRSLLPQSLARLHGQRLQPSPLRLRPTALRTLAVRGFDLVAATLSARAQPLPAAASTKDALDEETSTLPYLISATRGSAYRPKSPVFARGKSTYPCARRRFAQRGRGGSFCHLSLIRRLR